MNPFTIEQSGERILVTEHLETGAKFQCTFNDEYLAQAFIKSRQDIHKHGVEGAKQRWRDEEVKARRKLGLPDDPLDIDEPGFIGWA